jgi:hypothetical protein
MVGVRVAAMSLRGVGLLHGGRLSVWCDLGFVLGSPQGRTGVSEERSVAK